MPVDGVWPLAAVPAIALLALATGATTRGGAAAGLAVGLAVAAGAGWAGFAMLATLLVLGTALSARGARRRDALQVLCNGGAAAVAALLGSGVAVAGALGAALSDTIAGELGRRHGGAPRALLFGRRLVPGADGGMSVLGTLLGAAAALPVAAVGLALGALPDVATAAWVALAALSGNLFDSVLGLALQPRLGARGNDWTNLLATSAAAILALLAG